MFSGGIRGAAYGVAGGFLLGAVGNVLGQGLGTEQTLTWVDSRGTTKKFTHLDVLESFDLYKDLLVLHEAREFDPEAFNDACRHIQSVVFLYKRFLDGVENPGIMDTRKITNYSIMATRSMNALLISSRARKYFESSSVEQSMMNIHLSFDELINNMRQSSKDVLPEL